MERVHGEQGGHGQTLARGPGQAAQHTKQQKHVGQVQDQVDDVVAERLEAEKLEFDMQQEPR